MPLATPQKIRLDRIPKPAIAHKNNQLPILKAKIAEKSEKSKRREKKSEEKAEEPRFPAAKQPALNRHPAAKACTACERARTRRQKEGCTALGGEGSLMLGGEGSLGAGR